MCYANRTQCEKLIKDIKPVACLHCRFFERHEEATAEEFQYEGETHVSVDMTGSCRRFPPSIIDEEIHDVPFHPDVRLRTWCGEFQKAEEERGIDYVWASWCESTYPESKDPD